MGENSKILIQPSENPPFFPSTNRIRSLQQSMAWAWHGVWCGTHTSALGEHVRNVHGPFHMPRLELLGSPAPTIDRQQPGEKNRGWEWERPPGHIVGSRANGVKVVGVKVRALF